MKKSFMLFIDSLSILDELSDEQAGRLFKAIKDYQNGIEPDLDFSLKMAFHQFKNQFIRDDEKYESICKKNQENIGKRWNKDDTKNTSGINGIPEIPSDTKHTHSDKDKDKDTKNDKKKIFVPPTLLEVHAYFKEKGYTETSATKAFEFYNCADWKDSNGKQVKNWKQKMNG